MVIGCGGGIDLLGTVEGRLLARFAGYLVSKLKTPFNYLVHTFGLKSAKVTWCTLLA